MRQKVWLLVTLAFLLILVCAPVCAATEMRYIRITVHITEAIDWVYYPANCVECTLYAPDAGGIPLSTTYTNQYGYGMVHAYMYQGEDFAIWCRRNKGAQPFYLTIPIQFFHGYRVWDCSYWRFEGYYNHTTDWFGGGYIVMGCD